MLKMYRTKIERLGRPAGTIVFDCANYDYGVASDDTRMTGVEHVSVSEKADGGYPFFTIPKAALERIDDKAAVQGH